MPVYVLAKQVFERVCATAVKRTTRSIGVDFECGDWGISMGENDELLSSLHDVAFVGGA